MGDYWSRVERTRKEAGSVRDGASSAGGGGEDGLNGAWAATMAQKGQDGSVGSPMILVLCFPPFQRQKDVFMVYLFGFLFPSAPGQG